MRKPQRRATAAALPDELAVPTSMFATVGNRIRSKTFLLALYLVLGLALTAGCLWTGRQSIKADPTSGCQLRTDAKGFVAPLTAATEGKRARPAGIAALEFSGSQGAADLIVGRWSACAGSADRAQRMAHRSLHLDTLYVPLYVLTLAWWCLYWCSAAYRRKVRRLAGSLIVAAVAAGGLDLIENAALGQVVAMRSRRWAALATVVTVPKWVILAVAVPVAVTGILGALRRLAEMIFLGEAMQPEFLGRPSNGEATILPPLRPLRRHADPRDSDRREVERTERRSLDPHAGPWPPGRTGICLSGGGIRSASFALGVLQALHERPTCGGPSVYESADYLATVSGGGYTGTAAQILAHQHAEGDPPLLEGSSEFNRLRQGRRYLWSSPEGSATWVSTREFVSGVTLFAAGILFNVLLVVTCVYAVSHPLGWFARTVIFGDGGRGAAPQRGRSAALVVGFVLAGTLFVAVLWPFLTRPATSPVRQVFTVALPKTAALTATVLVMLGFGFSPEAWTLIPVGAFALGAILRTIWRLGRRRHPTPGPAHKASVRAAALEWTWAGLVAGSAWAVAALVATAGWYWADQAFDRGTQGMVGAQPEVVVLAIVAGAVTAILVGAALRVPLDGLRRLGGPPALSTLIFWIGIAAALIVGMVIGSWVQRALHQWAGHRLAPDLHVWLAMAGGLAVVYVFGDQKRWSPHPVYKTRLGRTFALTRFGNDAIGRQEAGRLPARTQTTLSDWAEKPPHSPELLICAAAYDSVERRPDFLRAWPFVFSHGHVGGSDVGWARTVDFEAVLGRRNQPDGTLHAAMAISGAAVSPAIGRINLGSANALVALANLRLGVWLPSPRSIEVMRRSDEPVPTWMRTRRFTYLLKEIVGSYDLDARMVYVTDGGQFDNLGLFELLARRCTTIYCFDASGDLKPGKPLNTATFDETRELARVRLGVVFSLPGQRPDPEPSPSDGSSGPTRPGALTEGLVTTDDGLTWTTTPRVPVAEQNVTILDIRYPDGEQGRLVLGKCVLTAEPSSGTAYEYATGPVGRHRFPADSTVDQWLDADQFDAYVDLGRTVGSRAVETMAAASS